MSPQRKEEKVSRLKPLGIKRYGLDIFEFFQCVECETEFPKLPKEDFPKLFQEADDENIMCNGEIIIKCPWCL